MDERCVYTALGHIHKPMTVSKSGNIYYSGSIAQYAFDDDSEKSVIIADLTPTTATVKREILTTPKKTVIVTATSEEEILKLLDEHANDLVLVRYESDIPLTPSVMSEMRKRECYCFIEVVKSEERKEREERKGKTDRELFEMFYKLKRGVAPQEEITELFLSAISEVKE